MIVCTYIFINLYKTVVWCDISEIIFDRRFILPMIFLKFSFKKTLVKGYTWYSSKWPVILDVTEYDFWSRFYIVILGMKVFFFRQCTFSLFFLNFYFFFGLLFNFLHKSRSDLGYLPSFFYSILWNIIPTCIISI